MTGIRYDRFCETTSDAFMVIPQASKKQQIVQSLEKIEGIIEKCGGTGGVPGPCPAGGKSPAHEAAHALATHITSEKIHDPQNFRDMHRNLEDHEKMQVQKHLADRGLLHPVDARKKKPMIASDVIKSAQGQYNLAKDKHEMVPTNRHVPFSESDTHKKMRGES